MYAKPYTFVSGRSGREYEIPAKITVCEMCYQRGKLWEDCIECGGGGKTRYIDEEACEQSWRLKVLLHHYIKQQNAIIAHDNMCARERVMGA